MRELDLLRLRVSSVGTLRLIFPCGLKGTLLFSLVHELHHDVLFQLLLLEEFLVLVALVLLH